MGQRTAPEMPERIFRAAHDTCKPELTQTPSLPRLLVSFQHLSLSPFSVLSHRIGHLGFRTGRPARGEEKQQEEEEEEEVRTQRDQEPGAEAGMRQVFFVCVCASRVCKCAHVCSVLCASRLSAPSMRPLSLGLVVVSVALPGCSALFSPAVAGARPLCLGALATALGLLL